MSNIAAKRLRVLLAATILFLFSALAFAQNWGWQQNHGQVKRLYPTNEKTFFQLKGGATAMNPKDGYYYIPRKHDNYQALVDLLYLAGEKGWKIYARTQQSLNSDGHAEVIYLVVDF